MLIPPADLRFSALVSIARIDYTVHLRSSVPGAQAAPICISARFRHYRFVAGLFSAAPFPPAIRFNSARSAGVIMFHRETRTFAWNVFLSACDAREPFSHRNPRARRPFPDTDPGVVKFPKGTSVRRTEFGCRGLSVASPVASARSIEYEKVRSPMARGGEYYFIRWRRVSPRRVPERAFTKLGERRK